MIIHPCDQRSPDWYDLRCGMPTASEFSKIVTSKGEPSKQASTYAITLAAELFAGHTMEGWQGNEWTERGRDMEEEAKRLYEFATDKPVNDCGFITNDAKTFGCSPDGLVGDDGLVEVKCLKAENHIQAILYHQKHNKAQADYIQQVQGQMMVAERQWCDLIFFHPELPLLTVRQELNQDFADALTLNIGALLDERDRVLAALHAQSQPTQEAA